ncbi:MAG: retroviral-like aspartic protease [Candidatus Blackburnbacteria bacterium]|nr:retroviral-like aspartic protease [Candidatus Blackburnbacteria bacterium]
MKFFYRELEVFPSPASRKKKKVLRPIIPVILVYDNKMVGYEALIDSGADYNVFDAGIAEILGIQISSGYKRQIAGIGGQKIKGYIHAVILKIADKKYKTRVIFSKEIPPHSFGVLGNQGFFDHFRVTFDYRRKEIVLI